MNKTLSIVIPTIGRSALEQTIASVLQQTVMPDEIIIWDNSGTGAARKYSSYSNYSQIKWKIAEQKLNIIDSWNTAVSFCNSEFIYILGDDDLLLPDFVKVCKNLLNDGAKLIHIENQFINAEGNIYNKNDARNEITECSSTEFLKLFATGNTINIFLSSLIFPGRIFKEIGGFKNIIHNGLAMDVYFNIELLAKIRKITVVYTPLWQYRTFVSDWVGTVKNAQNIPIITQEYLNYRDKVSVFFSDELAPVFPEFNRRRITSQIIGICYRTSHWKTFLIIFSPAFSFREKITMLKDIFYMMRH